MLLKMIAAAITDEPLGAPGIVSFDPINSVGNSGNTAGIIFKNDGFYAVYRHGVPIDKAYWLNPPVNMGDYEIYATVLSGDTPTGTIGSWEPLSISQEWSHQNSTPSTTLTCQLQIEIRWTGNNVVQDTATYTLSATAGTPGGGNNPPEPV